MIYDLIILGGGPAGSAASVYAARKQLKTLLITEEFGGQSIVSSLIYNWIGTPEISGENLAQNFKKHSEYYKGEFLEIVEGQKIVNLSKTDNIFTVKTNNDKEYQSKTILVATGSGRKKLQAENAEKFEHKGITYCASCDGPLFEGQDVVVIGGGNAAFETAFQLLAYTKSVTLLHRSENFRADEITVEKVLANPKMKALKNIDVLRVDGEQFVSSITYKDKITGEENTIETGGIFVEIGQIPNNDFLKENVSLDEHGKIIIDPMNQRSKLDGLWAAGDITNGLYHQNNIAAGDAVKALEDLYIWIQKNN